MNQTNEAIAPQLDEAEAAPPSLLQAALDEAIGRALIQSNLPDKELADKLFNALMNDVLAQAAQALGTLLAKAQDPDGARDDFMAALDEALDEALGD